MEVFTEALPIIYQQLWLTGEVPADKELANLMPISKKGWKKGLRIYRKGHLTLGPGRVVEQITLSVTPWHIQDS